jgi:two-component system, OmpR family, response regulator
MALPDIDGFSFIKAVRQMLAEDGGQVPVIAMTATSGEEFRLRLLTTGFQGYICKPLNSAELIVVVSAWAKT